jgi:hypothetical protein
MQPSFSLVSNKPISTGYRAPLPAITDEELRQIRQRKAQAIYNSYNLTPSYNLAKRN